MGDCSDLKENLLEVVGNRKSTEKKKLSTFPACILSARANTDALTWTDFAGVECS